MSKEAAAEERVLWAQYTQKSIKHLKDQGVQFITLDKKPFFDATQAVRDKYGAQFPDLIKKIADTK
jgi:TRAP-type C4-dicarboxylate transport system substrate-binding protein